MSSIAKHPMYPNVYSAEHPMDMMLRRNSIYAVHTEYCSV
jgi:hypothetical protein